MLKTGLSGRMEVISLALCLYLRYDDGGSGFTPP